MNPRSGLVRKKSTKQSKHYPMRKERQSLHHSAMSTAANVLTLAALMTVAVYDWMLSPQAPPRDWWHRISCKKKTASITLSMLQRSNTFGPHSWEGDSPHSPFLFRLQLHCNHQACCNLSFRLSHLFGAAQTAMHCILPSIFNYKTNSPFIKHL